MENPEGNFMTTTDTYKEHVREMRDRMLELFVAFIRNLDSLEALFAQLFPGVEATFPEFQTRLAPEMEAAAKQRKQILDEFYALQILFIEATETLSPDDYQEIVSGYEHILVPLEPYIEQV